MQDTKHTRSNARRHVKVKSYAFYFFGHGPKYLTDTHSHWELSCICIYLKYLFLGSRKIRRRVRDLWGIRQTEQWATPSTNHKHPKSVYKVRDPRCISEIRFSCDSRLWALCQPLVEFRAYAAATRICISRYIWSSYLFFRVWKLPGIFDIHTLKENGTSSCICYSVELQRNA